MTPEEARALIRKHSTRDANSDQISSPDSFLGSLRPYVGLREENFRELMTALRVLAPSLRSDKVDRELMSDLWSICWQSSLIGLDVTGALQRNEVLNEEETNTLADWLFNVCFTIDLLLEGEDETSAFADYDATHTSP